MEQHLSPPDTGDFDELGTSVAVEGTRVILGAPHHDPGGVSDGGAAYVFDFGPKGFEFSDEIELGNAAVNDSFGTAVALVASDLPPNQFGIFFYGANPAEIPFGDGYRCMGGQMFRFAPQSTQAGSVTKLLDLEHPPAEAGRIEPGSTWRSSSGSAIPQPVARAGT